MNATVMMTLIPAKSASRYMTMLGLLGGASSLLSDHHRRRLETFNA